MSPTFVKQSTIRRARSLRRDMTDGERRLWTELRNFRHHYGIHVRKQAPIGPFVADFAIHSAKLIIEVDGESHHTAEGIAKDARRDSWLARQGYRVIHLTTGDVEQAFNGCIEEILGALGLMDERHPLPSGAAPPPLTPPHKGEGNQLRENHKREP